MKKKNFPKLSKLISKASNGIFNKMIDLVLFFVYYTEEMGPFEGGSLYKRFSRIGKDFSQFNSQTLRNAFKNAQQLGWINKKLEVTSKGQKRLESVLPKYEKKSKWNGRWYITAYDIPENKKWLRDILRGKLKELKFGQLQMSLFISPFNFLGDVEKIIKRYNLSEYVLLAVSNKLGREPSNELAERIWKLRELNNTYKNYIREVKGKKLSSQQAVFKYLVILSTDPQLPSELLPDNWKGEEAYKLYRKFFWKGKLSKFKKRKID